MTDRGDVEGAVDRNPGLWDIVPLSRDVARPIGSDHPVVELAVFRIEAEVGVDAGSVAEPQPKHLGGTVGGPDEVSDVPGVAKHHALAVVRTGGAANPERDRPGVARGEGNRSAEAQVGLVAGCAGEVRRTAPNLYSPVVLVMATVAPPISVSDRVPQ